MYKCLDCGHIFEDGEEKRYTENVGECFGFPAYQEFRSCPICGGDFEETVRCEICGEEHLSEELNGGVCDSCIDQKRKDFDACYKISLGETETIKINALLASLLEECDIEQILIDYIKTRLKQVDCSPFIDNDSYWFGERLAEEVRKNEQTKN